jgi:hypothetical protein
MGGRARNPEDPSSPTTIHVVIPAKAGTQAGNWVPAFAGMTAGGAKRPDICGGNGVAYAATLSSSRTEPSRAAAMRRAGRRVIAKRCSVGPSTSAK